MLEVQHPDNKTQITLQPIDYNLLAAEITQNLRGEMNQRELSKRLDFSFNQVGKWESQVTQIKWSDFLHLAKVLNIPIEKYFREYFFWSLDEEFSATTSIRALMQYVNIAHTDWHRAKSLLEKWLNGTSMPDFSEVLMMMNTNSLVLIGWLSKFIDCSKIVSLEPLYKSTVAALDAVLSSPVCSIVNAALHLQSYKNLEVHDESLLINESGCTRKEVRESLALLLQTGAVSLSNKKYHSHFSQLSFIRHPVMGPKEHTANPSISSTRIAPMSSEASKKVLDLMVKFHNDVTTVIKEDTGIKDHVRLMVLHNFVSNIHGSEDTNRNKDS
jgi:transcriptional regulator with XRE-family HTH domain